MSQRSRSALCVQYTNCTVCSFLNIYFLNTLFYVMDILSTYMYVYKAPSKRHWIFWNQSYRWFWESNVGTLKEQTVFLTTEPTIQPYLLLSRRNRLAGFFFLEKKGIFVHMHQYIRLCFPQHFVRDITETNRKTFYSSHLNVLTHLPLLYLPESSMFPGVLNCPWQKGTENTASTPSCLEPEIPANHFMFLYS